MVFRDGIAKSPLSTDLLTGFRICGVKEQRHNSSVMC